MATSFNRLVEVEDPTSVLARLRRTEAALSSELVALRETIVEVEAALRTPRVEPSLLTVVEAARELRVSRSRVFELLASGELDGVMIGRARCVPRRSLNGYLARLGAA
jgi:excisionase family DNA binding protein